MKQYRVCTRSCPPQWLQALDPLEPGRAEFVRSIWIADESEATVFDSNMYADQVARHAPGAYPYVVVRYIRLR